MEDCIDKVGSAAYVTKLDLQWVPYPSGSRDLLIHHSLWLVFSFGNAIWPKECTLPCTFQGLMNRVLSDLEGCAAYLDNVVVCGDT